jgi:Mce-associated membrane protein
MTVLEKPRTQQQDPAPAPSRHRIEITAVRALAALVALAAIAALFFGGRWVLAVSDDGLELAAEREAVLMDARQAAININTLDSRNVPAGLDLWEESATGTLLDDYRANRAEYEQALTQARRSTAATVLDAAVVELDMRAGTARVLAAVDVEVRPDGEGPVTNRWRLEMEMTRTDQDWKASRVAPARTPS